MPFARKLLVAILGALTLAAAPVRGAQVKVITTIPDLAWAANRIGGNLVDAKPLLNGTENPHYVDAVPDYIRQVADAQVVCLVGLELEIGWMPKVLSRSGNADVQPGGKGYCDTGKTVDVLEKPTGPVDRAMGDIHPDGNPHFWLSPKGLAQGSKTIRDTLIAVDPMHAANYSKGYAALVKELDALLASNAKKLKTVQAKLTDPTFIEYHKEFTYLFNAYHLTSMGSLEEKPGIPPSAGRIAQVSLAAKGAGVKLALAGEYAPKSTLARFTELSGIKVLELPTATRANGQLDTYPKFQNFLVDSIIKALR